MKTGDEVRNDRAYDVGQKWNDEKSQQNDEYDVGTFFHFFGLEFSNVADFFINRLI